MSRIDNVALFNQLTHDENGLVDYNVSETILTEFIHFLLMRHIAPASLKPKYFSKANVEQKGKCKFIINFPNKKAAKDFCELPDTVMYRGVEYGVNREVDGLKVTVNFERW